MIQYKDVQFQNMINLNNSIREMLQNMKLDWHRHIASTSETQTTYVSLIKEYDNIAFMTTNY